MTSNQRYAVVIDTTYTDVMGKRHHVLRVISEHRTKDVADKAARRTPGAYVKDRGQS